MKLKRIPGILLIIIGIVYFINGLTTYLEVVDSDRIRNSIIIMICGLILVAIGLFAYRKVLKNH